MLLDALDVRRRSGRHGVGRQAPAPGPVLPRQDHRLADPRVPGEDRLDLPQLHPHAADLDLVVDAAQEVEAPVREPADEVAGPVHPFPRLSPRGAPRVGQEPLRRQLRPPQVATGETRAADVELARHSFGDGLPVGVQHVDPRVRDGPADRREAPRVPRRGRHRRRRGHHAVLGRAVVVHQQERGPRPWRPVQPVAADHQGAEPEIQAGRDLLLQHRLGQRRGEEGDGDLLLRPPAHDPGGGEAGLLVGDVRAGAGREERPELPDRGVESRARHQGPAVRPGQIVGLPVPVDQVEEPLVGDGDPLGTAGRSRGVDHVGEALGPEAALRRAELVRRDPVEVAVQGDHGRRRFRQPAEEAVLGEDHRGPRVLHQVGEPLPGVGRIESDEGAACLEDGEEAHHALGGPFRADRHQHFGADTQRPQRVGEPVAPGLQLAVGEPAVAERHRHGVGPPAGLRRDQLVHQWSPRPLPRRVVPLHQQLAPLGGGEQRQLGEAGRRVPGHPLQQDREVACHAAGRRHVEQIAVVLQVPRQPPGRIGQGDGQVEHRRVDRQRQRGDLHPREPRQLYRRRLQGERHLEQRRVAEAALRRQLLDDPLERQVAVRVRSQRRLPRAVGQLGERRISRGVGAQHQGVDEESDQPFELLAGAPRRRRAHQQIRPARVAVEEGQEPRQRRHEQRFPAPPAQSFQPLGEPGSQDHRLAGAAERSHRRPRPVGRQLEDGWMAGEPLAPVGELAFQHLAPQPLPLPDREISVLHRQLRQRRGGAGEGGAVERLDLAQHHPHRPAVGDDVVHREHQRPFALAGPQQEGAEQRTAREIEGSPRRRGRQPLLFAPARRFGQRPQIDLGQDEGSRRLDHLHRAVGAFGEAGAQRLVTAHDLAQGGRQRCRRQAPSQPVGHRHVVDRRAPLQPVEEPEPRLGEGQRQLAVPRHRQKHWRQRRAQGGAGLLPLDPPRQGLDGGGLEQRPDAQLHP